MNKPLEQLTIQLLSYPIYRLAVSTLLPRSCVALRAWAFEKCSPIQAQILPHTLEGHDAIGKAQTGTGKTAAFLITLFNDLLNNPIEGERYLASLARYFSADARVGNADC